MRKQLTTQEPVPVAYQVRMSDGRWGTIFHHPDKPLGEHRPLYAHPPQPSASVADALQLADDMFRDLGWHSKYEITSAALRALKGDDANG